MEKLDPNFPLQIIPPTYKRIRNAMEIMQAKNGYAIEPTVLARIFYGYLQNHCPSKMNKLKAKNMSKVFSVLLNESYLCTSEHGGKQAKEWFYMTDARWEKHLLNKRNIQRYIKLLMHMKLLGRCVREHPLRKGNSVTYYKIDPDAVENLANGIYPRKDNQSEPTA